MAPDQARITQLSSRLLEGPGRQKPSFWKAFQTYKRESASSSIRKENIRILRLRELAPSTTQHRSALHSYNLSLLATMMHLPLSVLLDQLLDSQDPSAAECPPTSCRSSARAAAR